MIYIPSGGSNFYLSEHFMTWEFKCRCCGEVLVEEELIVSLEKLRGLVGEPIYVNSGYRCSAHNKAVGGAKNSYHMKGMATDIRCGNATPKELAVRAKQMSVFGGIGIYPSFIHVDIRKECVRW